MAAKEKQKVGHAKPADEETCVICGFRQSFDTTTGDVRMLPLASEVDVEGAAPIGIFNLINYLSWEGYLFSSKFPGLEKHHSKMGICSTCLASVRKTYLAVKDVKSRISWDGQLFKLWSKADVANKGRKAPVPPPPPPLPPIKISVDESTKKTIRFMTCVHCDKELQWPSPGGKLFHSKLKHSDSGASTTVHEAISNILQLTPEQLPPPSKHSPESRMICGPCWNSFKILQEAKSKFLKLRSLHSYLFKVIKSAATIPTLEDLSFVDEGISLYEFVTNLEKDEAKSKRFHSYIREKLKSEVRNLSLNTKTLRKSPIIIQELNEKTGQSKTHNNVNDACYDILPDVGAVVAEMEMHSPLLTVILKCLMIRENGAFSEHILMVLTQLLFFVNPIGLIMKHFLARTIYKYRNNLDEGMKILQKLGLSVGITLPPPQPPCKNTNVAAAPPPSPPPPPPPPPPPCIAPPTMQQPTPVAYVLLQQALSSAISALQLLSKDVQPFPITQTEHPLQQIQNTAPQFPFPQFQILQPMPIQQNRQNVPVVFQPQPQPLQDVSSFANIANNDNDDGGVGDFPEPPHDQNDHDNSATESENEVQYLTTIVSKPAPQIIDICAEQRARIKRKREIKEFSLLKMLAEYQNEITSRLADPDDEIHNIATTHDYDAKPLWNWSQNETRNFKKRVLSNPQQSEEHSEEPEQVPLSIADLNFSVVNESASGVNIPLPPPPENLPSAPGHTGPPTILPPITLMVSLPPGQTQNKPPSTPNKSKLLGKRYRPRKPKPPPPTEPPPPPPPPPPVTIPPIENPTPITEVTFPKALWNKKGRILGNSGEPAPAQSQPENQLKQFLILNPATQKPLLVKCYDQRRLPGILKNMGLTKAAKDLAKEKYRKEREEKAKLEGRIYKPQRNPRSPRPKRKQEIPKNTEQEQQPEDCIIEEKIPPDSGNSEGTPTLPNTMPVVNSAASGPLFTLVKSHDHDIQADIDRLSKPRKILPKPTL